MPMLLYNRVGKSADTAKSIGFTFKAAADKKSAEIAIYDEIGPGWAGMIDANAIQRVRR